MKVFTLVTNENGANKEINFSGDMSLQEAKNIIEVILNQQVFQDGMNEAKYRIRRGFKKTRRGRNQ